MSYEIGYRTSAKPRYWTLSLYGDGSPHKQDRKTDGLVHLALNSPRRQVRARDVKKGDIVHIPLQWHPSTVTREVASSTYYPDVRLTVLVIDGHCYRFDNYLNMVEVQVAS